MSCSFFFNDTATTEIYTLSLHDALPISPLTDASVLFQGVCNPPDEVREATFRITATNRMNLQRLLLPQVRIQRDRKSTRLNSSHLVISYAVFCLKKKNPASGRDVRPRAY